MGDLEEQPRVLLVIFRLMRGHSWGRKCPGTAAYSLLCVCAPAAVCMCGVYLRGGGAVGGKAWGESSSGLGDALGLRLSRARCVPQTDVSHDASC